MAIMEACAEYDDELLERFLSGDTEFTPEEIIRVVRKATIDMKITPVLCGSSYRNKGVQKLLDSIVDFCPPRRYRER